MEQPFFSSHTSHREVKAFDETVYHDQPFLF
jgi:hypothetical protein